MSITERPPGNWGDGTGTPGTGEVSVNEDLLLLERIRQRDLSAFGGLYDKWVDRAYSVSVGILGRTIQAEEVVEHVFRELWREADQYHSGFGSVEAWIVLTVRRHALNRRDGRTFT